MKKKFLTFLLAICLIIPCGVIMTACGGKEEPPTASVQSSKANVLNTDYSYNESEDCITFLMTDTINFQKSDFEIVQTYTDDTTKTLESDKWTLDLSEIPAEPQNNGYYRIVFKYADKDEELDSITVTFVSSQINIASFETQTYSTTYTGEEIDVVDMIDDYLASQQQSSLTSLIESGIVSVVDDGTSTRTAINSATYFVEIRLANGYEWTAGDSSSKFVSWKINQVEIPVPSLVSSILEYDYEINNGEIVGVAQSIEYTFGNFQNALQFVDINRDVQEFERFTTSATNVGNYSVRFDIKEEFVDNYTFIYEDYYMTSYDLDWEITPVVLTIPTLKVDEFTYNPNGFNPMEESNLNDYNSTLMTLTNYAGFVPQADSYSNSIRAELKDLENFLWDYESGTSEDQYLYFTVNKADVELPDGFDESKLKMEVTWSTDLLLRSLNSTLQDSVAEYSKWTADAREYMFSQGFGEYHYLEWSSEVANTDLAQAGAGTYTYKMKYNPDSSNYNNKELNVTVEVLKEKQSINIGIYGNDFKSPSVVAYDGKELDISVNSLSNIDVVNDYATSVTYSVGYKATESEEYQYSDYTQAQFDSINGQVGYLMKNAGYYDLKISVTADSNHLFYIAGADESTAVQNFEAHQPIVIEPYEVRMAMGFTHNLDSNYYSSADYDNHPRFYYKDGQSIVYTIYSFADIDYNDEIYANLGASETKTLVTNTMENLPTCTTLYRASEDVEWAEATNTTDIGFYKNVYTFTSVDTDNIVVKPFEYTWEVISANVNFTGVAFEEFTNPTFTGKSFTLPTFKAEYIPSSVINSGYTHKTGTNYSDELYGWEIVDGGDYATSWWFKVPNHVTVTYLNEELPSDIFTTTTDEDYTTYSYNYLWSVEKYVLKDTEVDFDSYTDNQTLEYTGEELTPEYEIVVNGWDLAYDYPRNYFIISRVTKQNDVEVTPIDVGDYVTTITIEIYIGNFTIDDSWKESLTGLTEKGNFYCITRTINWSIVEANA